jgi:hypothetical protein
MKVSIDKNIPNQRMEIDGENASASSASHSNR